MLKTGPNAAGRCYFYRMKIITAKTAGFCMGVKRAVDMALDNTARYPHGLYTLGPLIHNKQTIDMLRERGARELDESQPLPQSAPVLIRAHGVAPEKQRRFESQGHEIIDGTCPKVKTVHKVITRYRDLGYSIVVTGDEGHAEVIGLMGYAGDRGTLIDSVEAVASLPRSDRVCLVSQTTFDKELFDRIAAAVRARFGDECVVVKKTICAATEQRQNETRALAKQVDALIVVGGINSANTRRLAQIAQECGTATQHVETEKQIDWNRLRDCRTVGITAGASTPHWMIKRVVDYVVYLDRNERRTVKSYLWRAFDTLAHLNIFVSLGAVAMYYASCHLQNLEFRWRGAVIAFLYGDEILRVLFTRLW